MDFDLTAEQREIQQLTREFADAEIRPSAAEWDREHRFPRDVFTKLAELGLMGACIPEEYGGAGADFLSYILVLEELSRADAGRGGDRRRAHERRHAADPHLRHRRAAVALGAAARAGRASRRLRPHRARRRLGRRLAPFARGADGDGWTITASKQWITNAAYAGAVLLFARTDPETATARGVSAFVLDGDQIRVTRTEEKLGLNSSVTNDIVVEGVHVGPDRLLHEEGRGFRVAMATLDGGRIGIAAQALGIAQAAYDAAREYALERRQFGHRIGEFQAIQHKLANMSTEIDAARLLVYRAAWLKEQGRPHAEEGAKAKLFASEMARRQTAEAIQVFGGYGYTKEFPVERYYRDAKITEIYEGTSEIQRLVIARSILGLAERSLVR